MADHYGSAQSTVEEGLDALLHLSTAEDLEDVTGEFFDGKSRSRALSQTYDIETREKLKNITEDIPAEFI